MSAKPSKLLPLLSFLALAVSSAILYCSFNYAKTANDIQNEALIKYFAAGYIKSREEYKIDDYMNSAAKIKLMSSQENFSNYIKTHSSDSETSPMNIYGDENELSVKITNIKISGKNDKGYIIDAGIEKTLLSKDDSPERWGSRIELTANFIKNIKPSDHERIINPLGFQVLEYKSEQGDIE